MTNSDMRGAVAAASREWVHLSACRDEDPELFFPIGNTGPALLQIADAKAVCRRCPVVRECLDWALVNRENHGVWGGMSVDERRKHVRRSARERRRIEQEQASRVATLTCRVCAQELPVGSFGLDSAAPLGTRSECRSCRSLARRARSGLTDVELQEFAELTGSDRFPAPRDERWSLPQLDREARAAS